MTYLEELRAQYPKKSEAWIMDHVAGFCPEPKEIECPFAYDDDRDCYGCWNREMPKEDTSSVSAQALTPSPRGEGFDGLTAEREGAILEAALAKWGEAAQAIKAIEELSELQTQLARWACGELVGDLMPRRKDPEALERSVREEIADCYIMLEQMELVFGDVAEIEEEKLLRLEEDTKDAAE